MLAGREIVAGWREPPQAMETVRQNNDSLDRKRMRFPGSFECLTSLGQLAMENAYV